MKTPRVSDFDPNATAQKLKSSMEDFPVIEKPHRMNNKAETIPVPPPDPRTVPRPVPLIPKTKRAIRQRQPFDIYEDQYERLKKIAESEREFVNGRGMSRMVREAIDNYLKDHTSPKE